MENKYYPNKKLIIKWDAECAFYYKCHQSEPRLICESYKKYELDKY